MAFRQGFLDANPQLLEPVYEVEVTVPADYMGDVLSDLMDFSLMGRIFPF